MNENAIENTPLGKVYAMDKDIGSNAEIMYFISGKMK